MSLYPNAIDGEEELTLVIDTVTGVNAKIINDLRSAIINLETELGLEPKADYGSVRKRIDFLAERIEYLKSLEAQILIKIEEILLKLS